MKSLLELEEAILENNIEGVSCYLVEINHKTGNHQMKKAGEEFGFVVLVINGVAYALVRDVAKILGYYDASGLLQLMAS